ncbi:autotransporter outer membrane beta-barrel domain-containing protein [Roseibium album]|uniref:autotransporter outer membrane beta-barrel domain-containing protein n=1 Tax=Roseibium album TaxID=311410 RepID=UPI0032F08CF6
MIDGQIVEYPVTLAPGVDLTVEQGGKIIVNGSDAVAGDDGHVVVNGGRIETSGGFSDGVEVDDFNTVTNAGVVETSGGFSDGVDVDDFNAVTNAGVVETSGGFSDGVDVDDFNTVTNAGVVETSGIFSNGIVADDFNTVTNTGWIKTSGISSAAIIIEGNDNVVSNSGTIQTGGAFSNGIESDGDDNTLSNSGWIKTTGESANAVKLGVDNALTNTGTLIATGADSYAVLGGAGTQTVTIGQGSQIIGSFDLGAGNDIVSVEGGPTISQVLTVENVETVNVADNFVGVVEYNGASKTISSVDLTGAISLGASTGALTDSVQKRVHAQAGLTGAWASVFGQHRDFGAVGSRQGYSFAFGGVMGGYERAVGFGRFGVVGGASVNEMETQDFDSTTLDGQSIFAGAYYNTLVGPATLITGLLAGFESNDSERILVDNLNGRQTARGTIDSTFVSASMGLAGTGWALGSSGLTLQPSGLVNYTASFQNDYTEKGAARGNLSVDSRTSQQLSARVQMALGYTVFTGLQAILRTGVDSRTSFEDDIDATLEGQSLTLGGDDINENFIGGFVGLGAAFAPTDRFSVSGDVEYQFGQDDTETFSAGINVNFTF